MVDRTTQIDMSVLTTDRQASKLAKRLIRHSGAAAPRKALAETLSRTAAQARKEVLSSYDDWLDKPTAFTTNPKSTLFKRAIYKPSTDSDPNKPLELESAVFIKPIQSAYLTPLLEPTQLTDLYSKSPVIVPHTKNLRTFEKLRGEHVAANRKDRLRRNRRRKRYGRTPLPTIKKLPDVSLTDFGNVKNLKSKAIQKLLAHPDVFIVNIGEDFRADISPGIYVRINFDIDRRVIKKLFHFEESIEVGGNFLFTEAAVQVYQDNFLDSYRKELKNCYRKLKIPIQREFRD